MMMMMMMNHIEHNRLARRTATRSQTRPVCNKGTTQFLPVTHTRTIVSVLPSRKTTALNNICMHVCLPTISVKFLHQGHRVKVKVTGAKQRVCVSCSRAISFRLKKQSCIR